MVSTKLPAVHSPTIAPNQSRAPLRTCSTSLIGPASTLVTSGGRREKIVATAHSPSSLRPISLASAAARMKKGKSATMAR